MQQQAEAAYYLFWPEISNTLSIVAIALSLAIMLFGYLSGIRSNIKSAIWTVILSTVIGFFTMSLIVKAGRVLGILNKKAAAVVFITIIMFFIAAVAICIYEIVTVTAKDIGFHKRD